MALCAFGIFYFDTQQSANKTRNCIIKWKREALMLEKVLNIIKMGVLDVVMTYHYFIFIITVIVDNLQATDERGKSCARAHGTWCECNFLFTERPRMK